MTKDSVLIVNKLGLHARAAAKLVGLAGRFESVIKIAKDKREVDGKSIMSVMMLAASKGTEIDLIIDGNDEQEAMEAIKLLIADRFGEEE
ncbi:MAG: HPr family phosphocarrier protein [Hahellaceae bacterium]|nr:HPr family phosphocarrier protein [Hahellaceae bacterium]MCP5169032.1 HPr family phosphocarrier protein [Hahellaceae bacterium]